MIDAGGGEWPSLSTWERLLPGWFVEACSGGLSPKEAEAALARWRAMSREEQAAAINQESWSLDNWLYWLQPGERHWYWWDATIEQNNILRVSVEVADWPTPLGALMWLLRAAGATATETVD